MCQPAPIVNRYGRDVADHFEIPTTYGKPGPGGVFLGSVGDQKHSVRKTSHNCASAPGGQESPVDGVAYHPDFAHAWDCRPATEKIGYELVRRTLADPFGRVRYVLYADHGWYPDGTFESIADNPNFTLDHDTFHVSFLPGTHDDTRPFFTDHQELTDAMIEDLIAELKLVRKAIVNQAKITQQVIRNQHDKDRLQQARLARDHEAVLKASKDVEESEAEIARLVAEIDKGDD